MKITGVKAIPFRMPLKERLKWSTGYIDFAEHVLIRIMTDEGTEGLGEAVPRPTIYGETQESIVKIVNDVFGPKLVGLDPFDIDKVWDVLNYTYWNPTAKGAVDIAMYDIMGKKAGVPCYKILGGYRNKIPLSIMISLKDMDGMINDVQEKYNEGYRAFKLKGGIDPDFDIKMCRNVRKSIPLDAIVYMDANQGYDYLSALRVLKSLEGILDYCEEPLPAWNVYGRQKLAKAVDMPLLGDESVFTVNDVKREIDMGILSIINVKMPRTGFTLTKKIVALCESCGIPMLTGTQAETTLGATACAHLACGCKQVSLPCENAYYQSIKGSLLTADPVVKDVCMYVPEGPGLGVELDEEKVDYYSIK